MIDEPVRLSLRIRVFAPVRIAMTVLCAALLSSSVAWAGPIVLTGADRRPATSLDGDWASIVDPFLADSSAFTIERRPTDGSSTKKPSPAIIPTEYDFSKAPTLKVPARLEHAA